MGHEHHSNERGTSGSHRSADDIDVFGLFLILWRRKFSIVLFLILGIVGAYFALSVIKPQYTASALILVHNETDQKAVYDLTQILKSKSLDTTFILTELEVLKSRKLAAEVVKRLDLVKDPEFAARPETAQPIDRTSEKFRKLSVDGTEFRTLPPEAIDPQVSTTINHFLERLRVASIPGSVAVKISFTSDNPYKAAIISNAIVDVYREQKINEDLFLQQRLTRWLDERLKSLREQVFKAETQIQIFKIENELAEKKIDVISADQVTELNEQLIDAQARRSEVRVTLRQLDQSGDFDSISVLSIDGINPSVIKDLRLDEVHLNTDISELSNRYGPKHPKIQKKRAELETVQGSLETEKLKIKSALQTEFKIADARVKDIEKQINDAAQEISENTEALVTLQELEREADSSRLVLQTFLETYKRSIGRDALQGSGVKIISDASVPQIPSYPNPMLFMALSIFLSLFLGVAFAILRERSVSE